MPSFPENRALGRSFSATILWGNKTNRNAVIKARVIKEINQGRKKSIRSFYHITNCCLNIKLDYFSRLELRTVEGGVRRE